MLLNCGVGEDSWESLGLQGDPISSSSRRSVLGVHWKDWCWSWNSNTLATWCEELTQLKRRWCWERLKMGRERGWDGWMGSPAWWTWVWASSRSWWWTGKVGVLQSMGSQSWTRLSGWTELTPEMFGPWWSHNREYLLILLDAPWSSASVGSPWREWSLAVGNLFSHLANGVGHFQKLRSQQLSYLLLSHDSILTARPLMSPAYSRHLGCAPFSISFSLYSKIQTQSDQIFFSGLAVFLP